MRSATVALCLFLSLGSFPAGAADIQIPPSPSRWATDTAGFVSSGTLEALDQKLGAYAEQTGHQVIIYIGGTTGGYPIEEFAAKAFEAWKVGRRGLDDGAALFIMAEDRAVRIEVGYGLEGVVPDITAGRIINDILIPKIRAGDPDGAVGDAVSALLAAISGEPVPAASKPGKSSGHSALIIIGIIIFAFIFLTNPSLALWLLVNMLGSGGGGGGFRGGGGGWGGGGSRSSGGGGGGFRGGGGRSGGGGASGRW